MTASETTLLELAFLENLREILIDSLRAQGITVGADTSVDEAAKTFFNHAHRSVEPRPRRVHRSRELDQRHVEHDHADVIDAIEASAIRGDDLRPHLSRQTARPMATDDLRNDWGLLHFHLGSTTPEHDGYVTRSGPLLFVFVCADDLFMVDVLDHGEWANDDLIEIIHSNWPETLAQFRMAMPPSPRRPTPEERTAARRAGITMPAQMRDGTVYYPPGGGQATNRTATRMRSDADWLFRHVRGIARWCCHNEGRIRTALAEDGVDAPDPMQLGLVRLEHEFAVIEATTGTLIRIQWDDAQGGPYLSRHEQIAVAAYLRWCGRGRGHGGDVEDWFAAMKALGFSP